MWITPHMLFPVYVVREGPVLPDPDMPPGPRYRTSIFVQVDASNKNGWTHHVTGDLVSGMVYERRPSVEPEASETFYDKTLLGHIRTTKFPQEMDRVLRGLPAPPPQKAYNSFTGRTEPIKTNGHFYGADEERTPLTKCTEWIEKQAIPALRQARILV